MANPKPAALLDLSDLVARETFDLEILKPGSDVKTGWVITLAGPAHPLTVAVQNEISREGLELERAIEAAQVNGRKWKPAEDSVEERRRRNVSRVTRRIVGWSPDPVFRFVSDAPIAFSPDRALDLFLRRQAAPFLVQVTNYLAGETAFMPPSGTT